MDNMKQIKHLKVQTRMLLNASIRGTMRMKNVDKVKKLKERMCKHDYAHKLKMV